MAEKENQLVRQLTVLRGKTELVFLAENTQNDSHITM